MDKDYTFSSERLFYRGITQDDAGIIVDWRSRPENYENFFNARRITLEEHLAWFESYLEDASRYDFMIIDREGRRVGTVGLSNITQRSCEISYMIGEPECRGLGYAAEAIRAVSGVAFAELGVECVEARILAHNEASMRAARRAGMTEHERVYRLTQRDGSVSCQPSA